MPDYVPNHVKNTSDEIRDILEREGFVDSPLQLDEGQLWGLIKDGFPQAGLQLHVRAFYLSGKLLFRAHTEPTRFSLEHIPERFRSHGEGTRIFMETVKQYGIEINYEGNILDLYVTPERPKTFTPWVPIVIVGGIVLFFIIMGSLPKPPRE